MNNNTCAQCCASTGIRLRAACVTGESRTEEPTTPIAHHNIGSSLYFFILTSFSSPKTNPNHNRKHNRKPSPESRTQTRGGPKIRNVTHYNRAARECGKEYAPIRFALIDGRIIFVLEGFNDTNAPRAVTHCLLNRVLQRAPNTEGEG